jgi:hypothetical protein
MAPTAPLPYLPPELWLNLFSQMDDLISLWHSRFVPSDSRENVDAYFRSEIIPNRIFLASTLYSRKQGYNRGFFSQYSTNGRIAYFLWVPVQRVLDNSQILESSNNIESAKMGIHLELFPNEARGADKVEMFGGHWSIAAEHSWWRYLPSSGRETTLWSIIDTHKDDSAIAKASSVAAAGKEDLKIYFNAEKSLVRFD